VKNPGVLVGVVLLLLSPLAALAFYGCLHNSMHRSGDEGFYFSGMLAPFGLTALWLLWFGIVLVRKTPRGAHMKVPGAIALLALVSSLFMNIWRMGGYAEDRPLALLYLAPAVAVGLAGIGNMLDDGKSKSARTFYILAPIAFVAWIGLAFLYNQATRG
jgi:hypothetical protein